MINNIKLKHKQGLSLLELLIVMLVFAILLGLGYSAAQGFKASTELRSANMEFQSVMKYVENKSRNNVVKKGTTPGTDPFINSVDANILQFNYNQNTLDTYLCKFDSLLRNYTCQFEKADSLKSQNSSIKIGSSNSCSGVLFENLTGNMKILEYGQYNFNAVPEIYFGERNCQIKIVHNRNTAQYTSEYIINAPQNNFTRL